MSIIEALNGEMNEIKQYLLNNNQLSMLSNIEKNLTKLYALSMASYFEKEIQNIIIDYVNRATNNSKYIENFIRKKAVNLQYHTYFSWGEKDQIDKPGKNANTFFALFGEDFRASVEEDIRKNQNLDNAIKSFIEIGHIRNILVHSNFAAFKFDEKTTDELISLYHQAEIFIDYLKNKFALL
jgi:hypothetical protein